MRGWQGKQNRAALSFAAQVGFEVCAFVRDRTCVCVCVCVRVSLQACVRKGAVIGSWCGDEANTTCIVHSEVPMATPCRLSLLSEPRGAGAAQFLSPGRMVYGRLGVYL